MWDGLGPSARFRCLARRHGATVSTAAPHRMSSFTGDPVVWVMLLRGFMTARAKGWRAGRSSRRVPPFRHVVIRADDVVAPP